MQSQVTPSPFPFETNQCYLGAPARSNHPEITKGDLLQFPSHMNAHADVAPDSFFAQGADVEQIPRAMGQQDIHGIRDAVADLQWHRIMKLKQQCEANIYEAANVQATWPRQSMMGHGVPNADVQGLSAMKKYLQDAAMSNLQDSAEAVGQPKFL